MNWVLLIVIANYSSNPIAQKWTIRSHIVQTKEITSISGTRILKVVDKSTKSGFHRIVTCQFTSEYGYTQYYRGTCASLVETINKANKYE